MQRFIYIADDEENIREIVKSFLESEGYLVQAFADGDQLLAAFQHNPCDLVILDIMMPGSNGFTVCVKLRQVSTVPIIMLTARDSDLDYATGINLGSDDYFTKPFSAMSLVMRVKAIFRRIDFDKQDKEEGADRALRFGDISMDMKGKTVLLDGSPLELTPNEFNLLAYLMSHKERAVSRDELLGKVWGYSSEVETRAADDTVRRLRKKLTGSNVVMFRAFANLISNAIRYAQSRITLSCHRTGSRIVIAVADDGPGIDPEDQPHIFDRFYKGKGGKHGIGLSIVKAVIEEHGGKIEPRTTAAGTSFVITFPL